MLELCIMLPKTNGYVRSYDGKTKWMYFSIEDDELLKKYDIWNKASNNIKKKNLIANTSSIKHF